MSKTISILGCGWLGLPLGQHLVERGFEVKGSTTTPEKISLLKASKISPFLISCSPQVHGEHLNSFFQSEVLFLNIPFKRSLKNPQIYLNQIQSVISCMESFSVKFVIFASSTSVYPRSIGEAREDKDFMPDNPRALILKDIEQILLDNSRFDATIIRFAGLYGGNRKIGRFLSGRREARDGASPVNLIHLDDCVAIVTKIIEKDIRNEIFNACSDEHPTRKQLYTKAALEFGVEPPRFWDDPKGRQKIVTNQKLKQRFGYQFKHPNPLDLS